MRVALRPIRLGITMRLREVVAALLEGRARCRDLATRGVAAALLLRGTANLPGRDERLLPIDPPSLATGPLRKPPDLCAKPSVTEDARPKMQISPTLAARRTMRLHTIMLDPTRRLHVSVQQQISSQAPFH